MTIQSKMASKKKNYRNHITGEQLQKRRSRQREKTPIKDNHRKKFSRLAKMTNTAHTNLLHKMWFICIKRTAPTIHHFHVNAISQQLF